LSKVPLTGGLNLPPVLAAILFNRNWFEPKSDS
jgi:hypothetical protein